MHSTRKRLIGDILIERGMITLGQLEKVLALQQEQGGFLCSLLIREGMVEPRRVFEVLSEQLGIPWFDLKKEKVEPAAVNKVPVRMALHYVMMPVTFDGRRLTVVLADPLDIAKLDDLRLLLDCEIDPALAWEDDIVDGIRRFYGVGADILDELMSRKDPHPAREQRALPVEDLETAVEDASIVSFVNHLFVQAVDERATDIHLEPYERELRVRFRIDGFLYEAPVPESVRLFHQAIVSRIKIMADLDIAEHRVPQDGRIKLRVKGKEIDFRVSVLPSAFGEAVQIRILGARDFISLEQLGMMDDDRGRFEQLLTRPYGIIFVTGPTGSGKSTTLYAALSRKNHPDIKIITAEDPIENQMRGVTQIQINPRTGLTFAESLRSILRHDPDIIMVGEVRDPETAEITIRSAMTGHLVFSTIHTNDAAGCPTRLIDMGIEPFLVASSLEGLMAQRLVRVICPLCRRQCDAPAQVFKEAGFAVTGTTVPVWEGKGCEQCRHTGYRGRTALFEMLVVDDDIRELIFKRMTSQAIKEKAVEKGMRTLRQDGLRKVLEGKTTLSEVLRVT